MNDFDQALTLRQVSWLYSGEVVKSVDYIGFLSEGEDSQQGLPVETVVGPEAVERFKGELCQEE